MVLEPVAKSRNYDRDRRPGLIAADDNTAAAWFVDTVSLLPGIVVDVAVTGDTGFPRVETTRHDNVPRTRVGETVIQRCIGVNKAFSGQPSKATRQLRIKSVGPKLINADHDNQLRGRSRRLRCTGRQQQETAGDEYSDKSWKRAHKIY